MASTTLYVAGDTFIRSNSTDTNYNNDGYLALGYTGSSGQVDRILLGFSFLALANKIIDSAKLYMYQVYSSYAEETKLPFTAHNITASWSAGTVTWSSRPAYDSTNGATALELTGNSAGWRSFTITPLVKDIVENDRTSYGILLKQTNEASTDLRKQFEEEENSAYQAYINVTYYDMPIMIASSQGSVSKQALSMKIAPVQGAVNKTVIGMKIAPVQGPINKTVF